MLSSPNSAEISWKYTVTAIQNLSLSFYMYEAVPFEVREPVHLYPTCEEPAQKPNPQHTVCNNLHVNKISITDAVHTFSIFILPYLITRVFRC